MPIVGPSSSGGDVAAHLADTSDAHDASAISFSPTGTIAATDVQAAIAEVASEAAGGFTGQPAIIVPQGLLIASNATPGIVLTNNAAQMARSATVIVPAAMKLRSMWINVTANGSGSLIWGLYSYASSVSAATELATGTAAPGGTGWREIAATSAPVTVAPGAYVLIVFNPAANASTIATNQTGGGAAANFFRAWATYTWDTTPDISSGSWADSSIMWACYLEGDLDGAASRL